HRNRERPHRGHPDPEREPTLHAVDVDGAHDRLRRRPRGRGSAAAMMIRSRPPGPRQSRLAAGCAGLLLGSWLALGAVPTPAAAGPIPVPTSPPPATAAKPGAEA